MSKVKEVLESLKEEDEARIVCVVVDKGGMAHFTSDFSDLDSATILYRMLEYGEFKTWTIDEAKSRLRKQMEN